MSRIIPYRAVFPGTQPEYLHAPYVSSVTRAPRQPAVLIPQTLSEVTGPVFASDESSVSMDGCNLSVASDGGEAMGQRIVVSGRVVDEAGKPVTHTLVEVWQANAAGRYLHRWDQHNAPLDPNFRGQGQVLTDDGGRYEFITIRPGCYPWGNHYNAWRPAHIHFSLFGTAVATRLVTQMYFEGDSMLPVDPIFNCVPDEAARNRLVAHLDWETTQPNELIGYRFDIVLRGPAATPMEDGRTR